MKRMVRVLIGSLILLMVVAAVSPVMACNARRGARRRFEKIPISFTSVRTSQTPPTKNWTIGDKFIISWGSTVERSLRLNLPTETLVGTSNYVQLSILNLETDVITLISDDVWTFPGGTFEGSVILEIRNFSGGPTAWDYTVVYCVFRGTGAFKGQIVILSYEGPFLFGAEEWTGFLFKR